MPFSMRMEDGVVVGTCSGVLGLDAAKAEFVTARDVDFGMVRMVEVFRERPATEVHVFRDYDTALAWAREPQG